MPLWRLYNGFLKECCQGNLLKFSFCMYRSILYVESCHWELRFHICFSESVSQPLWSDEHKTYRLGQWNISDWQEYIIEKYKYLQYTSWICLLLSSPSGATTLLQAIIISYLDWFSSFYSSPTKTHFPFSSDIFRILTRSHFSFHLKPSNDFLSCLKWNSNFLPWLIKPFLLLPLPFFPAIYGNDYNTVAVILSVTLFTIFQWCWPFFLSSLFST